ncbi:MAG: DNA primase catalytic subunit PriS [Thermoplasmata archaeon]|jgi:DNA primase small subunit|nr:DNA primase catalytic subunit PriS [Thermoplasmata archaeon]
MASDESAKFISGMFARHYKEVALEMPERFSKREFGFMLFDRPGMIRHTGFSTRADLKRFLVERVPAHVYYSSAYYEKPDAPTMAEKKWMGADLIFDLDADHVRGAENLPYDKMLDRVKEEVEKLLDEFVLGDFGFDSDQVKIVFSGGRGYHLHINHPSVRRLSSHERREIVDYITGTDLDIDWVFPERVVEEKRYGDRIHPIRIRRMVKVSDGGWLARTRKGIDRLFDELEQMAPEERKRKLAKILEEGGGRIPEKILDGLYKELFEGEPRGIDKMRKENNFEVFSSDRFLKAFLIFVKQGMAIQIAGETDEPVTSDIKRLIRLPSTLHAKTGFVVVPLTRDELDDFDPFRDAVSSSVGDASVSVDCKNPVDLRLRDQNFSLEAGKNSVPEYVALHLICRRLATIKA